MTILKEGVPSESLMVLHKKEFRAAGELMAMSILQEDFQLQLFDEWCYRVVSSNASLGPTDFEPTAEFFSGKTIEKVFSMIYFKFAFYSVPFFLLQLKSKFESCILKKKTTQKT